MGSNKQEEKSKCCKESEKIICWIAIWVVFFLSLVGLILLGVFVDKYTNYTNIITISICYTLLIMTAMICMTIIIVKLEQSKQKVQDNTKVWELLEKYFIKEDSHATTNPGETPDSSKNS